MSSNGGRCSRLTIIRRAQNYHTSGIHDVRDEDRLLLATTYNAGDPAAVRAYIGGIEFELDDLKQLIAFMEHGTS